jgi:nonsense-mediated mRNA decay protein 3
VGALCASCYVEVYGVAVLPEVLELTYCRVCGSYKLQGQWVEGSGELLGTVREYSYILLSQKLKPTVNVDEVWIEDVEVVESAEKGVLSVRVSIVGRAGSTSVSESRIVKVKVNTSVCPSCARRISKTGYSAIVQVRPLTGDFGDDTRRRLEKLLSKLEARVRSSIISIERSKNGFDILVDDQNVARIIAGRIKATFGGYITETFKVTGVKRGGGRKGVLTVAVRILNVKPGDVIAYSGAPHIVVESGSQGLTLVNMSTGDRVTVDYESLVGVELLKAEDYAGGMLRRLQLSRIEGENLVFKDVSGGELRIPLGYVRVLRGDLTLGGVYLAYLLRGTLYLVGGLELEQEGSI